MATIVEQIADIQTEIDKTQKNKATEHHLGTVSYTHLTLPTKA